MSGGISPGNLCPLANSGPGLEFFEDVRTRWVAGPLADAYFGVCGPGGAAGAPRRRRAGRPGAGSRGARVGYNLVTETQYALDVSR